MFFCEYYKLPKNTYFEKYLQTGAYVPVTYDLTL